MMPMDRREFLKVAGGGLAAAGWLGRARGDEGPSRPKVAAILTAFTFRSHAHVLMENFLQPYLFNGRRTEPGVEVVSVYVDQFPPQDMAREVFEHYKIPIYPTIAGALTRGGEALAVDAVLAIGEHGDYPVNEKGQREYPRKRFFDEIVAIFEKSNRSVPVFNDKHLSYRWDWAKAMYDDAKRLGFPLMAGSSVPLAQRIPPLEIPGGTAIRQAVSIHGGPVESYDFHGLEVLQSMVENRKGGETGVERVRFLRADDLWQAADEGLWSESLADAAMAAELGPGTPTVRELLKSAPGFAGQEPHGILLDYVDGLRGVVLALGGGGIRWNFACEVEGQDRPLATRFHVGPWQNRNLFKALAHAIQTFFRERREVYPAERTLLTTGALAAAMDSRFEGDRPLDTPHLHIAYQAIDFRPLREMGATWEIITEETPEPRGIEPVGLER